jgi:hypothetical protein
VFHYQIRQSIGHCLIQSLGEGRQSGQLAACHQRVNLVGALVGVDCLHVRHRPHHVVLVQQPISSTDLPAQSANLPSPLAHPGLGGGDLRQLRLALVLQVGNADAHQQDALHVGHDPYQLLLDQLEA